MAFAHQNLFPTLNQRILRGFFFVVGLNVLFGLLMIFVTYLACEFTPRMMNDNYSAVDAVLGMGQAWRIIHHPEENPDPKKDLSYWIHEFEVSLAEEDGSISEPGEDKVVNEIHALWNKSSAEFRNISTTDFIGMENLLKELVTINQDAMLEITKKSKSYEKKVLFFGAFFLLFTTLSAIGLSTRIAKKLAWPLKKITEILHDRPYLGGGLSLPKSMTYEIDSLSQELSELWNHLSALKKLDVDELVNEKNMLKTILASVEDAILVVDNHNTVTHVNPGMLDILEVPIETVQGYSWSDTNTTMQTKNFNFLKNELIFVKSMENRDIELKIKQQKKIFEIRSRPILTDRGKIVGQVFLLHDVTESNQRERLKKEFIGVLSHELKTPVQSLSTAMELVLQEKKKLSFKRQFLLETMSEDLARIRAIANDFFQASLGEVSSLKINLENVKLNDVIHKWLMPFNVLAADKNIGLDFINGAEIQSYVKIDHSKFPWAVSNLLSNAIRVTPKNGSIKVSLSDFKDQVQLRVTDSGPGIPIHLQDRVFKPYFQVSNDGLSAIDAGFLGIGLTIAKEIVNAHGGEIRYYPNLPTGTVFEIQLPKITFDMEI